MVEGTVQADALTPDEVSKLAGITLVSGPGASEPPRALEADPSSCAVAVGPATQAVYGREWTAFLSATYQDSAGVGDYTVTQVIGVYSDSDKAGAVFRTLSDGLESCQSAIRTDQDGRTSKWAYTTDTATSETLGWTAAQVAGDGWACHRQARLKGRTVLQVAVCGAGNGKPAVTRITDRFAAKASG
ncbi:sensor domain-containing protein [Streptomyces sp. ISL-10]|uniref:sensor domain-containing protein n=1 Tax=Streptomyces sp. ISL-10 TaxID=2819172 RepID=UPI001BEAD269|nr:sensor domain-containing protein [Streptomyces sp. ISL-10]MBT2365916.1 sensor domain-containing protein [Streptomyces sp. ISL-10]